MGEDGSWGLLYEQATAEGPPVASLLHHILEYWSVIQISAKKCHCLWLKIVLIFHMCLVLNSEKPDPKRAPLVPLPMPKKLYFYIDPEIKRDIELAKQNLDMYELTHLKTARIQECLTYSVVFFIQFINRKSLTVLKWFFFLQTN